MDAENALRKIPKEMSMFSSEYKLKNAVVVLSPLILTKEQELMIEEHTSQHLYEQECCRNDVDLNACLDDPTPSIAQDNLGDNRQSYENSNIGRQSCANLDSESQRCENSSSRAQVSECLDIDSRNELLAKFVVQKADSSFTEVFIFQESESPIPERSVKEPITIDDEDSFHDNLSVRQIMSQDQDSHLDSTICHEPVNLDSESSIGQESDTAVINCSGNEVVPSPLMQDSVDQNLPSPVAVSSCIQNPDPPTLERVILKEPAHSCVYTNRQEISLPILEREYIKPTASAVVDHSNHWEPSPVLDRQNEEPASSDKDTSTFEKTSPVISPLHLESDSVGKCKYTEELASLVAEHSSPSLEEVDKHKEAPSVQEKVVSQFLSSDTESSFLQEPASKLLNNEAPPHNVEDKTTVTSSHTPHCSNIQGQVALSMTKTPTSEKEGICSQVLTNDVAKVTHTQDFPKKVTVSPSLNPKSPCENFEQKLGSLNINEEKSKSLSKKTFASKTLAFRRPTRRRSTNRKQTPRNPADKESLSPATSNFVNVPNRLEVPSVFSGIQSSVPCHDHIQYEHNSDHTQCEYSPENMYNDNGYNMPCMNNISSSQRSRGRKSTRQRRAGRSSNRRAGRLSNRGQIRRIVPKQQILQPDTHRDINGTDTEYLYLYCQHCGSYFTSSLPRMCSVCSCNQHQNVDEVGQKYSSTFSQNQEEIGYFNEASAEQKDTHYSYQTAGLSTPYSHCYTNQRSNPATWFNNNSSFQRTPINNISRWTSAYDQAHQSSTSECFIPACSAFQYLDGHGSSCHFSPRSQDSCNLISSGNDAPGMFGPTSDVQYTGLGNFNPGCMGDSADSLTGHDTSYMKLLSEDTDFQVENNPTNTDSMANIVTACRVAKAFA